MQQQNPNELNHTSDGFLNSILNDEDLQLMDMAVNEGKQSFRHVSFVIKLWLRRILR